MRTTVSIERTHRDGTTPPAAENHTFDTEAEAEAFADAFASRRTENGWDAWYNPMSDPAEAEEDRESMRWSMTTGDVNPVPLHANPNVIRHCQDTITIHVYQEIA